jgi:nucleoid-associated protein YgaU
MRSHVLLLLSLSLLVFAGCQNKNQKAAARTEEPYTPSYSSLDSMDAAPASDTAATYDSPPAETHSAAGSTTDEELVPAGGTVYTVQKGDTLYKLARQFYSDQARWRDIWEANKTRVPDPDRLLIGTKLIIP